MMDYIIIFIILLIPAIAQFKVTSNYNKYKAVKNLNNISGFEVARKILDANGLNDIHVVETEGTLSDHYDPKRKVVRLSKDIFHGETIAAASIAAHEVGHAIQDKEGYLYMRVRSFIYPVVNIATGFSYFVILIGVILQAIDLVLVGIGLTACGLVFQLVTLPVEFDASKRAKEQLSKMNLVSAGESVGVSKMLSAAAMTYVAGVIASAAEIIRLIIAFKGDD